MPAKPPGAVHQAPPPPPDKRRGWERRACALAVSMRTPGGDYAARLIDFSPGGIGVRIDALTPLRLGTRLLLVHPALGEVPCVLRWSTHPRYGAEFQAGSHALARIRALYDSLPPVPATGPEPDLQ